MTTLGYERAPGSVILVPVQGPPDQRPPKVTVPVKDGRCFPDGAIIMWGGAIGKSREVAEEFFRARGYVVEFVEVTAA